ncbi:hypothetical protein CGE01nite_05060 [Cellulomonas gelida]|uniref:Uncharacterized protein n=1 Tax=Cellulomonas gelida TaxID=1712 RepID=A0A4Y3KJH1_9CELL|nr:hypothetical protein CGE01nite_05060 [Cellulomonas gelida]
MLASQARDEEAQHVAARRIGPVRVLDGHEQRPPGTPDGGEQLGETLEQLELVAVVRARVPGPAHEAPERRAPSSVAATASGSISRRRETASANGRYGRPISPSSTQCVTTTVASLVVLAR